MSLLFHQTCHVYTDCHRRYVEQKSGVSYEQASAEREAQYEGRERDYQAYRPSPSGQSGVYEMDAGYGTGGYGGQGGYGGAEQYQQHAMQVGGRQGLGDGRWDSVSECYMLGGEDIRNVPWEGGAMDEIDAFVSEQLYIHSKVSWLRAFGELPSRLVFYQSRTSTDMG